MPKQLCRKWIKESVGRLKFFEKRKVSEVDYENFGFKQPTVIFRPLSKAQGRPLGLP
jgi:hypothetical protein